MYFVDRNKIEQTLKYLEGLLDIFEKQEYSSHFEKLGLERISQMAVESIIDVGNMMIDGFIMRDPGSYEDIVDILVDENVLPEEESEGYKAVINIRKMLVHQYLEVDHDHIVNVLKKYMKSLKEFSPRIRRYLNEELGPVSAFASDQKDQG
ncbi:MAG: DUF86 domain-containing protein [Bacillaceae bacterium]|nr:DUF86 domain-containing protein [Bacillaceae bacterium]